MFMMLLFSWPLCRCSLRFPPPGEATSSERPAYCETCVRCPPQARASFDYDVVPPTVRLFSSWIADSTLCFTNQLLIAVPVPATGHKRAPFSSFLLLLFT